MTKKDINEKNQDQIEAEVLEATEDSGDSRTPRQARGNDQRADTQRTQAWQPPSVLPDPKPQDGWVFRWVRTAVVGQSDNPNVSYRFIYVFFYCILYAYSSCCRR